MKGNLQPACMYCLLLTALHPSLFTPAPLMEALRMHIVIFLRFQKFAQNLFLILWKHDLCQYELVSVIHDRSLANKSWSSFRTAYMPHILGYSTRMIFTKTGLATSLQYFLYSESFPVNPCQNRVTVIQIKDRKGASCNTKREKKPLAN